MPQAKPPQAVDLLEKLFRTHHYVHQQFEKRLAVYDIPDYLTGPRVRFLIAIEANPKIRMNDVATRIGIKARTVTQFVDALEQQKLLIRLPDPEDRRVTLLQLTDLAPPLIKKARSGMRTVAEHLLKPLSEEQRIQFMEILNRLMEQKEGEAWDK